MKMRIIIRIHILQVLITFHLIILILFLEKELKSFYSNSYHKNPQFIKKGTNDYYIDKNKVLVKFDNKSNILQSK
jgi:hypothetical protein